jgi:hypothetical protein
MPGFPAVGYAWMPCLDVRVDDHAWMPCLDAMLLCIPGCHAKDLVAESLHTLVQWSLRLRVFILYSGVAGCCDWISRQVRVMTRMPQNLYTFRCEL